MSNLTRVTRFTCLAAVALLGVSACSDDSTSSTDSTDAAESTAVGDTTNEGSATDFCAINDELNDDSSLVFAGAPPDEVEAYFTGFFADALSRVRAAAPDEMKADTEILAGSFERFIVVLEEKEWDLTGTLEDPILDTTMGSQEFADASAQVEAFCS